MPDEIKARSPVRLITTDESAVAYPKELLVDDSTGNLVWLDGSLNQVWNKNPGNLTVTQGSTTLVNAQNMSENITVNIPEPTVISPATAAPSNPGTAAVGTSAKYAREDHVHNAQTTITGNAGSATKLQTKRKIGLSGVTATAKDFDGSADITIPVSEVPASIVSGLASVATSGDYSDLSNTPTIPSASDSDPQAAAATASAGSSNDFSRADHAHPLQTSVSGNAGTATQFASNADVTLTGDVTGTASSKKGWSVATTLANSGVTAGSYGPSENASPSAGGTFTVPYITADAKGRVTAAANKTITMPAGYTHPTYTPVTAGLNKIGSDSTGHVSSGSAVQKSDLTSIIGDFDAATANAAGTTGLVPAPAKGAQSKFLRGNSTWDTISASDLPTSGVTASSYGPSSNVSPGSGGTFTVPYVTVDSYGRITAASNKTITMVTNTDTHYTAHLYTASTNSSTSQVTAETTDPYLNLIENSAVRDSVKLAGAGIATVKSSSDGKTITIAATHPSYTSKSSGLYKITVDGTGHVSAATAVAKSDLTGIIGAFTAASSGSAGSIGLVPAPASGAQVKFLRGNSTWDVIAASDLPTSGVTASSYGPSADATLSHSGTFIVPYITIDSYGRATAASNITFTLPAGYTHPSYTSKTSGLYKITVDATGHVSAATAVAKSDLTGIIGNFGAADASTAGTTGLVPAPAKGAQSKFLRGNSTWDVIAASDLPTSGVTASSYGPSADATPGSGGTFTVPYVTVDSYGRITAASNKTITMVTNTDTHYTAYLRTASSDTGTSQVTAETTSPYLNLVENGSVRTSTRLVGAGIATVKSSSDGKTITITATHPSYTSKTSGLYKITVDGTGHVSAATAVAKSDLTGIIGAFGAPTSSAAGTIGLVPAPSQNKMTDILSASGWASTIDASNLPASGATAGSYGESAAKTVSSQGTFSIPYITVDTYGRVTAISGKTMTMGAFNNYSHPTYTSKTSGLYKITVDATGHVSAATAVAKSDLTGIIGAFGAPTSSAAGSIGLVPAPATNTSGYILKASGWASTIDASNLPASGVTAASYGPSADASPGSGGTFSVPYVTVDTYGRLTAASTTTITMPTVYGPSSTTPNVAGTAAVGTETAFARGDHVHPVQTSVSGNAGTATKLKTARTIGLSGVTATAQSFDGSANITIPITEVPASLITGVLSLDNIPEGAKEKLVVVADQAARLALTTAEVQNGDVVKQNDTGVMYYVKDDTKLGGSSPADAFEEFKAGTAAAVAWNDVTGKPSFASVATSGSYTDLSNKPTIYGPSDSTPKAPGTAAAGSATTFSRSDHVHAKQTASLITASSATGTSQVTSATTSPYVNFIFDGSVAGSVRIAGSGMASAKSSSDGKTITITATHPSYTAKSSALYKVTVDATGHVSAATAVAKSDLTGIIGNFGAADASTAGSTGLVPAPAANDQDKFLKADGTWAFIDTTNLPASGVTAASYGPSADASPDYSGTFTVPYVTVDSYGRITAAADKTITIPAAYSHPTYTSKSSGIYKITVDGTGHVSAATAVAKSDLTGIIGAFGAPTSSAVGTIGLVPAPAKNTMTNLLSASGWVATINAANLPASGATAGSYGESAAKTVSSQGTFSIPYITVDTYGRVTAISGKTMTMAAFNNYTHPSYTAKSSGFYKVTVDATGHVSAATAVAKADITALGIPAQDTTYSAFTAPTDSAAGSAGLVPAPAKATQTYILTASGWSGSIVASNLPASGVTAASYGPSADASPGSGGTFSVPYVTVDTYGRITAASTKTITMVTNTDTHHTAYLRTASSATGTSQVTAATSNPYLNLVENGSVRTSTRLSGSGKLSVQSSADGKTITISASAFTAPTDSAAGAAGFVPAPAAATQAYVLKASGWASTIDATNLPASGATAGSYGESAAKTVSSQGTFNIPYVTIDTYGRVTAVENKTMTMGAFNNYSHPTYTSKTSGLYKITVDGTGHVSAATAVAKADITALGIPAQDTTYSAFTAPTDSAAGAAGLVPAPAKNTMTNLLSASGWVSTIDASNLPTSGATAGSYGESTAKTVSSQGTFSIPYITVDTYGRVTAISGKTMTMAAFNNYSHPTYTSKTSGLYKITVDGTGHVSAATAVAKADITALGIPAQDTTYSAGTGLSLSSGSFSLATSGVSAGSYGPSADSAPGSGGTFSVPYVTVDTYGRITAASTKTITMVTDTNTHYTANLYTASSATSKAQVSAVTNDPYLNLVENSTVRNSVQVKGGTNATVSTSADGKIITIAATDTTYSAGTGLSLSGTEFSLATSGVTASSYGPSADSAPGSGGTFSVPYITVDTYGRITAASTKTITMVTDTNTHYTANLLVGASSTSTSTVTSATSDPYLILRENSTNRNSVQIKGSTNVTVQTSADGGIINISATDTTYSAGTGLSLSSGSFSLATSGVTAGSYGPSADSAPGSAGTFSVPYVTVDTYGRLTAASTKTITMPTLPTSVATLTTGRAIDGVTFNGSAAIIHYGTCDTTASTAAKTVSCTSYTLVTGSRIIVKFTVTNTAANPTLNVNDTGAKAIQYRGSAITAGYLAANRTYEFVYDGTYYQLVGDIDTNTTYSAGTGLSLSSGSFSLATSGATAGSYGESAAKTVNSAGTFNIPYVTVDSYGRVTSIANKTMTMAAFNNYSHPTYTAKSSGFYKVTVDGTGHVSAATAVAAADITALVTIPTYTKWTDKSLAAASWTGSSAPYSYALTVSGLATTDIPIVDFRPSGTYSTDKTAEAAWLNVYRAAVTAANTLTFYAHVKPTVAIPITIIRTK